MRLQKDLNLTYLFITHDISTVKAISDQVVVMNLGKVVEQGTKVEVFSPPHPPYTELLLSSVPEMDPDWLTNLNSERSGV
jgi:peptide/nickel transport system ATP-binding protein